MAVGEVVDEVGFRCNVPTSSNLIGWEFTLATSAHLQPYSPSPHAAHQPEILSAIHKVACMS